MAHNTRLMHAALTVTVGITFYLSGCSSDGSGNPTGVDGGTKQDSAALTHDLAAEAAAPDSRAPDQEILPADSAAEEPDSQPDEPIPGFGALCNDSGLTCPSELDICSVSPETGVGFCTKTCEKLASIKEETRGLVITLSGSDLFATNQSVLLPAARERLKQVANALLATKERGLIVEDHTDSQDSASYNLGLSQRRADAVRSYLISRQQSTGGDHPSSPSSKPRCSP